MEFPSRLTWLLKGPEFRFNIIVEIFKPSGKIEAENSKTKKPKKFKSKNFIEAAELLLPALPS